MIVLFLSIIRTLKNNLQNLVLKSYSGKYFLNTNLLFCLACSVLEMKSTFRNIERFFFIYLVLFLFCFRFHLFFSLYFLFEFEHLVVLKINKCGLKNFGLSNNEGCM